MMKYCLSLLDHVDDNVGDEAEEDDEDEVEDTNPGSDSEINLKNSIAINGAV